MSAHLWGEIFWACGIVLAWFCAVGNIVLLKRSKQRLRQLGVLLEREKVALAALTLDLRLVSPGHVIALGTPLSILVDGPGLKVMEGVREIGRYDNFDAARRACAAWAMAHQATEGETHAA